MSGKQQFNFFSNRRHLVITLMQLYLHSHVCENVNVSATFLGKGISTTTSSECNTVWLTSIHARKNYQKGLNYTTIKSTSALLRISAVKCRHIPFDITSISHQKKCTHMIYSGDLGFPFILETKHKCLISKEKRSFTLQWK